MKNSKRATKVRITLQVPMDQSLKKKAEQKAKAQGFSSLQEVIRVFTTNYVKHDIFPLPPEPQPSPEAFEKWKKAVKELEEDIKVGKAKAYTKDNIDELFDDLENGI